MKLSAFDLAWYQQWPLSHTALEEWSRPGLTNGLGSLQIGGDPTSVRHLLFPPVSGAEEYTGFLTVNGTFLPATLLKTDVRWCPWRIDREATLENCRIHSTLAMPPERQGAVQRVTLSNTGDEEASFRIALRMSGRSVNRGIERWYWGVPAVSTSVADLLVSHGLDPLVDRRANGMLFQERTVAVDGVAPASRAYNAQLLSPEPSGCERNGDVYWETTLSPGASFTFYWAVALDDSARALDEATALLAMGDAAFEAAEAQWRALWQSAFQEGGPLSGQLPDLDLAEELLPVAASSVLSLLQLRRTHRISKGNPYYVISTPRRVEACYYPNDWSMAARGLAQMDPAPTWNQFEIALKADVRKYNQINLLTGKGGDAIGEGWPYTVDIYNMFYAGWQLWKASGGDVALLRERSFETAGGTMSLHEVLRDFALDWRKHRIDSLGLADYGSKHELLECVSTYEHVVAGLNAAAVWMLRRLAEIERMLGNEAEAASLSVEADELMGALLEKLYVEGGGYFRCLLPDGRSREVRHCWDTGMVLMCVGPELPQNVCDEIVEFFQRELQTPGWIRALSPHDGDAAVSGMRADHQFNGAFGSWPAEVAWGLVKIGRRDVAEAWLRGIARTARQGPFAQAYYDEGVCPSTHEGATKVSDELPQCCHWANISGGMFISVLEAMVSEDAKEGS